MRKIALMAAAAAIACTTFVPALAGDMVIAKIAAINSKHRAVLLEDKTIMLVGDAVDLDAVKVGMKVKIDARIDEDGYSLASSITPVN